MKKGTNKKETIDFKKEFLKLKKENEKLQKKLEKSKDTVSSLRKELKKNDVQKIIISKEQEQSLLNQLKDINILNLLSD